MEVSRWKTLRAAIEELVETPVSDRAAAIDRIADDDATLRAELERLLPTWDQAPSLESPRAMDAPPQSDLEGVWALASIASSPRSARE